eukprot:31176-Pelagococcus_subviridis.AAC.39
MHPQQRRAHGDVRHRDLVDRHHPARRGRLGGYHGPEFIVHWQHDAEVHDRDEEAYQEAQAVRSIEVQDVEAGGVVQRLFLDANDVDDPAPQERPVRGRKRRRVPSHARVKHARSVRLVSLAHEGEDEHAHEPDDGAHDRAVPYVHP